MKTVSKYIYVFIVLTVIANLQCPVFSQEKTNTTQQEKIVLEMLQSIVNNDFQTTVTYFDSTLKELLPADKLKSTWEQLQSYFGKYKSISDFTKTNSFPEGTRIYKHIICDKDSLEADVVLNTENKVSSFYFRPVKKKKTKYVDAEYVENTKFKELSVKLSDTIITGKLTIPNATTNSEKFNCVVLVHGSGPNDLDETINDNKVFRDIAYGLSSNGIAAFRYNKRTLVDKNINVENFTANEETVFDAVDAVNIIKEKYSDKIEKVFVLGHSLGGYLLPRIAKLSQNADGFISLAGSARPLEVLIVEQLKYIYSLDSASYSDEDKKTYNSEIKKYEKIQSGILDKDSIPTYISLKYLLDLKDYDPVNEFRNEKRPILFIQGGRDYQVTVEDFNLWKTGLSHNSNCKFILLDNLNHILQSGYGKSKPSEYNEKKNVDKSVITNIIDWLKNIQ